MVSCRHVLFYSFHPTSVDPLTPFGFGRQKDGQRTEEVEDVSARTLSEKPVYRSLHELRSPQGMKSFHSRSVTEVNEENEGGCWQMLSLRRPPFVSFVNFC